MRKEQKRAIYRLIGFVLAVCIFFFGLEFSKKAEVCSFSLPSWANICNLFGSLQIGFSSEMTWSGVIVCVVIAIACYIFAYNLFYWVKNAHYYDCKTQNIKLLGGLMLLLWSLGWGLYLQAFLYYPSEHHFVNSELLLRSAIASLDLFMLDIDSNILDVIKEHEYLKGSIVFVCLLSFICTVGLLVSLVYVRLDTYIKLRFFTKVDGRHPHLYVFWGINTQTELLAMSVGKNDTEGIKVFVEQTKNSDDDQNGWSHLVNMLTHRRESFKKVKELNARLSVISSSLTSVVGVNGDVLGELYLNSLKRQIVKLKKIAVQGVVKPELHIFFLSEDEEVNIQSVAIIRRDEMIQAVSASNAKVTIYCHARYDSINSVIEDISLSSNIQVKIVDSAHLSVELLKKKESQSLYPVNFVKVEKDATVSTAFNSLVVGFGETGQDAVKYLYEYGAFVDNDKKRGIRRSPFCCHVVDKQMDVIAPHYMSTHLRDPHTVTGEPPLISFGTEDTAYVNLHNYDYREAEFQKLLESIIRKLHYVVITIGDDMENITLAVRILKLAVREKVDMRNFKILVRSHSHILYPHIQKIADHYNKLIYAELISSMQEERQSNEGINVKEPIVIFGKSEDIYSFSAIISDVIYKEAVLYYNSYNKVKVHPDSDFEALSESVKRNGKVCSELEIDYAWKIRREKETAFKVDDSTNFASVMSVRRKEAQDIENALHRHVKRYVALKALNDDETTLKSFESGIRYDKIRRKLNRSENAGGVGEYVYERDGEELNSLTTIMNTLA